MVIAALLCTVLSAALGFVIGCICTCNSINTHHKGRKNISEIDKKAERTRREYANFLTYDGTEQEDIII